MLHFLASVALCIFIGERAVYYYSAYKLSRECQRHLEPPRAPRKPMSERVAAALMIVLAVAVVGVVLLRMPVG